jgi:chloride channel protein, CIC family
MTWNFDMNKIFEKIREKTNEIYHSPKAPWMPRMVLLAFTIGIVGGLAAVGFHELILLVKRIFWGATSTATFLDSVRALPWQYRLIAPALGGLIIGPIITYFVKEARGHGVPEVMEAVALRGGVIRFAVAPLKALVSAICIGSGGAAGREGPIVQIGASFGSSVGTFLRLTPDKIKTLLAAGAAAGVAGTFNAPMAGVIFSIEVILREIKLASFSPIIIAAVTGTAVANTIFGRTGPIFSIPIHRLVSYWELFFYIGLGIFTAAIALLYSNFLYFLEDVFHKISIPDMLKPALGGLLLGGLALIIPQIHATGYPVMEAALHSQLGFGLVVALLFGKILATSLSLGSGGSGGIFAPALFIGTMAGSAYGSVIGAIFPAITASASSYSMVGMGSVFAGATHAPLSAIFIIFEMTRDPIIILPLMFSCIISSIVTSHVQKKNIYTTKLLRRGVDIENITETTFLEKIQVREVMKTEIFTIYGSSTIDEARKLFKKTFLTYLPVIDEENGNFLGMLNYHNVFGFGDEDFDKHQEIRNLAYLPPVVLMENDHLLKALRAVDVDDIQLLPVFKDNGSGKLVGVLSRGDIIRAYNQQLSNSVVDKSTKVELSRLADLDVLLDVALRPIRRVADAMGVSLEVKLDEDLPKVAINSSKLNWVLTNLIGNAVRYTPSGKKVVINAWPEKGGINIAVRDAGPGIPRELRDHIFDPKSSSYAMPMCKEIISANGGHIWVESELGKGTTFKVWLESINGD